MRTLLTTLWLAALIACSPNGSPAPDNTPTDTTSARRSGVQSDVGAIGVTAATTATAEPITDVHSGAPEDAPRADAGSTAKPARTTPLQLELTVSDKLARLLLPIRERTRIPEKKLPELFEELRLTGDAYCSKIHAGTPPDDTTGLAFFAKPRDFERYAKVCPKCVLHVMVGCWNYYRMNDEGVERDFEAVRRLRPDDAYDCYSVGMLQPYMMHNALDCRSLTLLDFSWRIQDAHHQLITRFRKGRFTDPLKATRGLLLGWSNRANHNTPTFTGSLADLCSSEQRDMCIALLSSVQERFHLLDHIQLDLAALHDGHFLSSPHTKVFFFSNALEPMYTTEKQLDTLLTRIRDSLTDGQRAILIHHVGGNAEFGLYELLRAPNGYTLDVLCRDIYTATASGMLKRGQTTYRLALDDRARNNHQPDLPFCSPNARANQPPEETPE